ncbi:protein-arginine deiminase family protein [uncultured Microscilla sp.]|uniref:protein-arginine deiminase family protein n=1 Tax=uncultured Microscilla sp. TaxID=432653 RepID=UPI00260C8F3F|nr:protein-arginine deiminase family protein [uncultured Microscilla sp.]
MNKTLVKKYTEVVLIEKKQRKRIKLVTPPKKIKQCVLKTSLKYFEIECKLQDEWTPLKAQEVLKAEAFSLEPELWIVPKSDKKHATILFEYQLHNDPTIYQTVFQVYQFRLELKLDNQCFDSPYAKDHSIGKYHWIWGKTNGEDAEMTQSNQQWGGIILADLDQDKDDFDFSENPQGGATELVQLQVVLPFATLPPGVDLQLYLETSFSDAHYFGLYALHNKDYQLILGSDKEKPPNLLAAQSQNKVYKTSAKIALESQGFYLRANHLPNSFFDGIITIKLKLKGSKVKEAPIRVIAEDHLIVRVAPWLMMPNTQEVKKVHIIRVDSETADEAANSDQFIKKLRGILGDKLVVSDSSNFGGDRWIQDEFVIGYCQGVKQVMPVVCDGPRDRGLNKYPQLHLLKADFGQVSIAGNKKSTLDSFGNLEVSPPVEGYPFGRIIMGASPKQGFKHSPRQIAHQLKGFLHAQKVQSPIEVFSDWLAVGHVDEIINFVPAHNPSSDKKFKMLIASSKKAIDVLSYVYFSDTHRVFYLPFEQEKQDSRDILKKWLYDYWEINHRVQFFLDWNRQLLKKELGLTEDDIIDVPVLFKERKSDRRALPLLPNMVNQLVITEAEASFSIVPKSYGPVKTSAGGLTLDLDPNNIQYLFEDQLKTELEAVGHQVYFVDDTDLYFKRGGGIHCATNVERAYFANKKWWKYKPPNAHDI